MFRKVEFWQNMNGAVYLEMLFMHRHLLFHSNFIFLNVLTFLISSNFSPTLLCVFVCLEIWNKWSFWSLAERQFESWWQSSPRRNIFFLKQEEVGFGCLVFSQVVELNQCIQIRKVSSTASLTYQQCCFLFAFVPFVFQYLDIPNAQTSCSSIFLHYVR